MKLEVAHLVKTPDLFANKKSLPCLLEPVNEPRPLPNESNSRLISDQFS
jgi:hypothetical protein